MSPLGMLAGLALRELWISFRLLAALGVVLVAAVPAAVVPPFGSAVGGADRLTWLAGSLGVAFAIVAALAAGTFAGERRRGAAGWMVARAVPRATILLAWFAAFSGIVVAGMVMAGLLAWFAFASALLPGDAAGFGAALGAAAAAALAGIALGLAAGALLPWPVATAVTGLAAAVIFATAALGGEAGAAILPAGGLALLSGLEAAARPVADAARAAGVALALAAALLVLAAAALEMADL